MLLCVVVLCWTFNHAFKLLPQLHSVVSTRRTETLGMSALASTPGTTEIVGGAATFLPKYRSAPTTARSVFGRKLTQENRKYMAEGIKFREEYLKLRLLTKEEEATAGKFSAAGARLERIKNFVEGRLSRRITDQEWANACKLEVDELHNYLNMAESARNRLVQHNLRLVDFWAIRLIEHSAGGKKISYFELVLQGIMGLRRAAELYDGRIRFHKYSQGFILNALYEGMTVLRPGSFLPHKTLMLNYRALRAQTRLYEELQRTPTEQEIAATLGVGVERLRSAMSDAKQKNEVVSADTRLAAQSGVGQEANLVTYLDLFLKAGQGMGGEYSSEQSVWQAEFQSALDCLTPTERRTLSLRYGLFPGDTAQSARTIEHTAELMCQTPEGVRKTIVRAMEKLRESPLAAVLEAGPPQMPVETTNGRVGVTVY